MKIGNQTLIKINKKKKIKKIKNKKLKIILTMIIKEGTM